MRIWMLGLLVLAILIRLDRIPPFVLSQEPRILKVCQGCPYGSIQEAVDAAAPGDVIEVYPLFYHPIVAYLPTAVTISKPLTLEAKPSPPWEVVLIPKNFPNEPGSGFGVDPIFNIKATNGQVVVRGFVFQDGDIAWQGGANLILERNRFYRTTPWSIIAIGLKGPGQAQLVENEMNDIDRIKIEDGAHVLLRSNRIKPRPDLPPEWGVIEILGPLLPEEIDKRNRVILEQNLIEGSIDISCSNETRLDDNILLGRRLRGGVQSRVGLWIGGICAQGQPPDVLQANRNLIARYQIGVAMNLSMAVNQCRGATVEELHLSGQENVIEQNDQDLCPPDYPWPPGFRK
jgi:hypothetical protein